MSTTSSRQHNFVDDKNAGVPITASRVDAELDNVTTKLNEKVIVKATAPSSPIAGMLWLDSTNKILKEYRNSEWVFHAPVHVGTTAPATQAEGDLWYDTTNNVLTAYDGSADQTYIHTGHAEFGPRGAMMMWLTDTAPTGWLLCDGSAVSRTTYADLFAIISTTYGVGDGSTTFNVPDLRGRFPLGQDDMGGSSADRVTNAQADSLGGVEGAETHTLTVAEMPSHTHTYDKETDPIGGAAGTDLRRTDASTATGSTGGDGAHNNMPPYITVNYIIKT